MVAILKGHTGGVQAVAFGAVAGCSVLASAGGDGTVRLWDLAKRETVAVLEGDADGLRGVAFGLVAGRAVVASVSGDSVVRIWDAASGRALAIPLGRVRPSAVALAGSQLVVGTDRFVIAIDLDESVFEFMS